MSSKIEICCECGRFSPSGEGYLVRDEDGIWWVGPDCLKSTDEILSRTPGSEARIEMAPARSNGSKIL